MKNTTPRPLFILFLDYVFVTIRYISAKIIVCVLSVLCI